MPIFGGRNLTVQKIYLTKENISVTLNFLRMGWKVFIMPTFVINIRVFELWKNYNSFLLHRAIKELSSCLWSSLTDTFMQNINTTRHDLVASIPKTNQDFISNFNINHIYRSMIWQCSIKIMKTYFWFEKSTEIL